MAAPAFVGAGAGAIIQTGGAAVTAAGSGVAVGDLVILQVLQDGIAASAVTYSAISGIANLAGTASSLTTLATDQACGTLAKQHLRVGRATSTTCSITCTTTGDDLYCRIYVFRGVNSGAALTDILENGTAGTVVNGSGTTAAITDTGVTTIGADRLALNFVGVDDDNPLAPFTGMTGGTWAEATAEYATATGTDAAIQLQISELGTEGAPTGSGSAVTMGDLTTEQLARPFTAPYTGTLQTVSLKLIAFGSPTDDVVVEIRPDTGGSGPSSTVLGSGTIDPTLVSFNTFQATVAAPITSGTTYWIAIRRTGAANASVNYAWEESTTAKGAFQHWWRITGTWVNATPSGTGQLTYLLSGSGAAGTINGGTQTMAAADSWGVLGFALKPLPSGPATHYGATALAVTANRAVAATKKTFAAVAAPFTATVAVAGIAVTPGVTHYGTVAAAYGLTRDVQATRKTFGQVLTPVAFTKAVQGQRRTTGQIAVQATFAKAVQATRKTFGVVAAPFVFVKAVQGIATTGAVTHYGATTTALTFTKAVQAQRRTTSTIAAPFAFTAATASRKQYAKSAAALTFGETTQARKHTFGVVARPTVATIVVQGIGFTGAQTRFGATASQYTLTRAVQGRKRTTATVALPITLARATQATRRTTSQVTAPLTFTKAVQARRRTHGQVLHPTTWIAVTKGTSTTGIQTYYGQLTAPYVLARAVAAQRRTFATTRTTITLHATTQAHLMAAILNLADDIRWGTTQPDRVLIGTQEVWTP